MPKYQYDRVYISAYEPRDFDPRDPFVLSKAVEYLKSLPASPLVMLVVEISLQAGSFKINAPASLTLDEITGKTPRQVWAFFDNEIDKQIEYF